MKILIADDDRLVRVMLTDLLSELGYVVIQAENGAEAVALFEGEAEGNAVVVAQMLAARGIEASVRTVQRAVAHRRRQLRAAELATVRFETAPGRQMQIDFGERRVWIAGAQVTVHFMAAVLSFSRRLFVKAFLHERQGEWLDGIASAFRHFGGVPQEVLGDNARCLVLARNRETQTVTFHPAYAAFCRDWDVQPRACRPYRARTKGKTESGVDVSGLQQPQDHFDPKHLGKIVD